MSKEFYKAVRYLQDDFSTLLLSSEKELVVPIDHNSKDGEIIIPIKSRNVETENITIYYALMKYRYQWTFQLVGFPKKIEKVNSLP